MSCQGGDYTADVHPRLRAAGWRGYWIDAASKLRMSDDAVIILDPVNREVIDAALAAGRRDYIGGNCTVSLMMMAIGGLLRAGLVRVDQRGDLPGGVGCRRTAHARAARADGRPCMRRPATLLGDPASAILDIDRAVTDCAARRRRCRPRSSPRRSQGA